VTPRGLEQLYREDGARLWRVLVAFSGDREVASDAVAEAYAQAIGREAHLRDPQRWVWRTAFRIAGGELKNRRRFHTPTGDPSDQMEEPPARLVAGLARLSPNQRAALVLHEDQRADGPQSGHRSSIVGVLVICVRSDPSA
jgi:DNA-directed RNA polymerase specialized sigma24 family protein